MLGNDSSFKDVVQEGVTSLRLSYIQDVVQNLSSILYDLGEEWLIQGEMVDSLLQMLC